MKKLCADFVQASTILIFVDKPSVRVDLPDNGIIRGKAGEDFELPFDNIPEDADVTFFKNGKEMEEVNIFIHYDHHNFIPSSF